MKPNLPQDARRASLHRDIKILSGLLLRNRRYDEATWLWMAFGSPRECQSVIARTFLQRVADLARQYRFATVSNWIEHEVLQPVD